MQIFISQTIDGFIAGESDSLDHLEQFQGNDYGYDAFIATVSAVIVGRRTFDRIYLQHGWTYPPDIPGVVMTTRPLPPDVPPHVSACSSVEEAVTRWPHAFVDGGAETIRRFIDIGAIRTARIFTLPITLGSGIRLFSGSETATARWPLISCKAHPCGTIEAAYEVPGP